MGVSLDFQGGRSNKKNHRPHLSGYDQHHLRSTEDGWFGALYFFLEVVGGGFFWELYMGLLSIAIPGHPPSLGDPGRRRSLWPSFVALCPISGGLPATLNWLGKGKKLVGLPHSSIYTL